VPPETEAALAQYHYARRGLTNRLGTNKCIMQLQVGRRSSGRVEKDIDAHNV